MSSASAGSRGDGDGDGNGAHAAGTASASASGSASASASAASASSLPFFGQLVIGPPGSGKTTYCAGMQQFFQQIERPCAVINLDPANDPISYTCDVDINELITLDDAMETYGLGPNGALVYCMEFLCQNLDWLQAKLDTLRGRYLLFDFPGQIELYTCSTSLGALFTHLRRASPHFTCVHLVDSYHLQSSSTFLSILLVSLAAMVQLEMPHLNVLTKIDNVTRMGPLPLPLEYYTEATDLNYLVDVLQQEHGDGVAAEDGDSDDDDDSDDEDDDDSDHAASGRPKKPVWAAQEERRERQRQRERERAQQAVERQLPRRYAKLTRALCELVENYGLVSFATLSIQDKRSVFQLVQRIDRANGYVYTHRERVSEHYSVFAQIHGEGRGGEGGGGGGGDDDDDDDEHDFLSNNITEHFTA